jgi:hypothetical protein
MVLFAPLGSARPGSVAGTGLLAATAILAACGWAAPALAAPKGSTCAALSTVSIPAKSIGLPTRGARVVAAEQVEASGSGSAAIGAYCKVTAEIAPIDTRAPSIRLIVNLPDSWNGKAAMFGGGGYDGTIPNTANTTDISYPARPKDVRIPLARGYATFSGDSGHQAPGHPLPGSEDGSFGLNDEALQNFAGDALKKTHDVATALIEHRYGVSKIKRLYFLGGSTGGREALAVVQRWPKDWDGVVSQYPAWNAASLDLQFGRITRAFAAPGAYPDQAKRQVLFDAAIEACDALDGVADGVVSNVAACRSQFDPATALVHGQPLRCPGGADTGDSCLSDAQIAALKVFDSDVTFGYPLASGETQYPGFNLWGSDLGLDKPGNPLQPTVTLLALGTGQPADPMPANAPFASVFWDQWVKYFVTRDPGFDSLGLDPQNPGSWAQRISTLTGIQDVNKTDLSAFRARGGKLILAHGTADVLVSTRATEQYYQRLAKTMGAAKLRDFVRFYEIPGYGHAVSTVFNAAWDSLAVLEKWVEKGQPPKDLVVQDTAGVPGRTRPLCEYPTWPRYAGSGDVNLAASFACVGP